SERSGQVHIAIAIHVNGVQIGAVGPVRQSLEGAELGVRPKGHDQDRTTDRPVSGWHHGFPMKVGIVPTKVRYGGINVTGSGCLGSATVRDQAQSTGIDAPLVSMRSFSASAM